MGFSLFERFRLYHLGLGLLAGLAYVSEDWTAVHVWFGYSLALIMAVRTVAIVIPRALPRPAWLISRQDNQPKLGVKNPVVGKALIAGIMMSLVLTLATGVMLDQSQSAAGAGLSVTSPAFADDRKREEKGARRKGSKFLKGIHETAANGTFALVGLHVAYLLLTNRRYAMRMLFIDEKRERLSGDA